MLAAALVASVVLRLYPVPSVTVYFEQDVEISEAAVQQAACPFLRAQEVPLPIPYRTFVLRRDGEAQRYVPAGPVSEGLLTKCKR